MGRLRELGKTGIKISPLGLGVMQFAGGKGLFKFAFPSLPEEEKREIVQAAAAGGINWFDTAEMYGRGLSERALAAALEDLGVEDDQVIIATKWMPFLRTARNIPRTIGERLDNLHPYTIDLYQVHNPWSFSSPGAEMKAMANLVEAGKIRSVGVSNFNADQMRRAHSALQDRGLVLASNQVQYSLLHREIETNGILETARELRVTIIAWSPLASGVLTGKFHNNPRLLENTPFGRRRMLQSQIEESQPVIQVLEEIAREHDAEPAQAALSWLINARGDCVVGIPGASKVDHVQESVGAMDLVLTSREMERLDEVSLRFRK
ncbi:MAG: aldo/keto reductase [Anaerolineales bacterium]|nr:aldo/keto reductase [Anaerolineales bacterium]